MKRECGQRISSTAVTLVSRITQLGVVRGLTRILLLAVTAHVATLVAAKAFRLWLALAWRRPIQDWLVAQGFASLTHAVGMIWSFVPSWLCVWAFAVVLGAIRPRSWFADAFIFSLLFVAVDDLLSAFNPTIGWPAAELLAWQAVAIPAALCGAFIGSRFRRVQPITIDGHPTCRQCRYILTGLPEARCPECGTDFSQEGQTHRNLTDG